MLGKAISTALIILGVYLLGNFLLDLSHTQPTLPSYSYHLGCYESDHSFQQSLQISQYLSRLTNSLAPSSASRVKEVRKQVDSRLVNTNGANSIALQFKKYIVAHENTKNMNEYEQIYNKGIRDARNDFLACRQKFLESQWNCTGSYQHFLSTDQIFNLTKGQLQVLISKKYEQQRNIEKLLEPFSTKEEPDNQTYHRLMKELNDRLAQLKQDIKVDNNTLGVLVYNATILRNSIDKFRQQLEDCRQNKKEVQFCKNIGQKLNEIFLSISPSDIQSRIALKQTIIEKYDNAMAKSLKLGIDTSQFRKKVDKEKAQLANLIGMYAEVESASQCGSNLIKCSDQNIQQLEVNVSSMETQLTATILMINATEKAISSAKISVEEIEQMKKLATEEYQNSLGSLEKIKQRQTQNIEKLKIFRDNVNNYNQQISSMEDHIDEAQERRKKAIKELNVVLQRVGELTDCLAKKDYLLKLQQGKKPQRSEQDILKKEAGDKLIGVIRSMYS